jgi:hypothetical protein
LALRSPWTVSRGALITALGLGAAGLFAACHRVPGSTADEGDERELVASAGPDMDVRVGTIVTLSSSASVGPPGATFRWTVVATPNATFPGLDRPTGPSARFLAADPGAYVFDLVLETGTRVSLPDRVTVRASGDAAQDRSGIDDPPLALIYPPTGVHLAREFILDGRASRDPEGSPLDFNWSLVQAPPFSHPSLRSFSDPSRLGVTPDLTGILSVALVVKDSGGLVSQPFVIDVNVGGIVQADAGVPQKVTIGDTVTLDGSASTGRGRLAFSWDLLTTPFTASQIRLDTATTAAASFVPTATGDYVAQLTVHDEDGNVGRARTSVHASESLGDARVVPLPFSVADAEASDALQAFVTVGNDPEAAVHIIPYGSGPDETIQLPVDATTVAVDPSGQVAAVGHDGWLTIVDLQLGITRWTLQVPFAVGDVVVDGTRAIAFSTTDDSPPILVDVITGEMTQVNDRSWLRSYSVVRLHPDGKRVYSASTDLSPNDIYRMDVLDETISLPVDSRYHGQHDICGGLWLLFATNRLASGCGTFFQLAVDGADDITYTGSLESVWISGIVESSDGSLLVASIRERTDLDPSPEDAPERLVVLEPRFLEVQREVPLPAFRVAGGDLPARAFMLGLTNNENGVALLLEAKGTGQKQMVGVKTVTIPMR